MKLDFTKNFAAQDMIRIIMRDKDLCEKAAIDFAINKDMYQEIVNKGYASIAFNLWGHDDPEREWDELAEPIMEIELSEEKEKLIADIADKEKVETEIAVSYFLIFTMDLLGYHI